MRSRRHFDLTTYHGLVTSSAKMMEFFELVRRVARTESSVLIRGETGTGKELVARALYGESGRRDRPFKAVNCATFTAELLVSELFGHVKGSFTGAVRDRIGLFEAADGGTVFLDEIAEMPQDVQPRLLRVLQERTITPLGTTNVRSVDVRLISATNKALRQLVEEHRFREDLMYRIRVVPIYLPRLVDRGDDVEALLWHFIDDFNVHGPRYIESIDDRAFEAIRDYSWPGNVRELRNVVEYAFAVGEGNVLRLGDLTPELRGVEPDSVISARSLERDRIVQALEKSQGRKGPAAELLGISRSTLWRKMREHQLQ